MNIKEYLLSKKAALPILSFPGITKQGISVKQLVNDSTLQAQVLKTVADSTPSLASVSFMDLSIEAEAFGSQVRFTDNEVPTVIGSIVSDLEDAKSLNIPKVGTARTGLAIEAIKQAKRLITDRPLFAGAIGPYSLTGRLCDVTEVMYLCYDDPDCVETVLNKATSFIIDYCKALKLAGANGVVIAEPLAGLLSADMANQFSLPFVKRIIEEVQTQDFAVIYHNCGNSVINMLPDIFSLGATAYHFGNSVNMASILEKAPSDIICMGNIDPAGQFANGTPESIREATTTLLDSCANYKNFIISSGCDIPPHSSWENIDEFFRTVKNYYGNY